MKGTAPRPAIAGFLVVAVVLCAGWRSEAPQQSRRHDKFLPIYRVLISPRCVNCHSDADAPLQGDDSHLHVMNVKRGRDGLGTPAMRCGNCHQDSNSNAEHGPPGTPDWKLPPPNQLMAWKGRSAAEVCRSLKDPAQNGGKDAAALAKHIKSPLVLWGWHPGSGRTVPPEPYAAFSKQFKSWLDAGTPCPVE